MTPDRRTALAGLLKLAEDLPDHELRVEGVPFVSGAVRRQRVTYAVPGRRLSAWLLRPASGNGPWPGLLALHPHSDRYGLGGDEVAGQCGQREHHYGYALAARGFVVLCPDLPCFGQQQAPPHMPSGGQWESLWMSRSLAEGRSLLADSVDQLRCAVAALLDYEKTADLQVSVLGYGLGARLAAWLTWSDQRIRAVWMHAGLGQQRLLLERGRLLPRHLILPGLWAIGCDQAEVVADILPRAVGISFGRADQVALPEAVAPVLEAVRARAETIPRARLAVLEGDYDHRFPPEVLGQIGDQLRAWATA
jgi:dienelactone hydrolase